MAFFSFGKRVKNQTFNFIPRHYDPAKDDLEDRLRMATDEQNPEIAKMRIKSGFKRKARGNKQLESQLKRSANIRLLLIISALIAASYVLMTSDGIMNFIQTMSGDKG